MHSRHLILLRSALVVKHCAALRLPALTMVYFYDYASLRRTNLAAYRPRRRMLSPMEARKTGRAAKYLTWSLLFYSNTLPACLPVYLFILCGYSFLSRRDDSKMEEQEEEWYDIHRLVHLATRIWVEKRGDAARVREEAVWQVAVRGCAKVADADAW